MPRQAHEDRLNGTFSTFGRWIEGCDPKSITAMGSVSLCGKDALKWMEMDGSSIMHNAGPAECRWSREILLPGLVRHSKGPKRLPCDLQALPHSVYC